jgi:hypothetical protein
LPLMLARHATAVDAARAFEANVCPDDFSPAWILVGDRDNLFFVDMASGGLAPGIAALSPGVHVLENASLFAPSPKVEMVRASLAGIETTRGAALIERLQSGLRSHDIPATATASASAPAPASDPKPGPKPKPEPGPGPLGSPGRSPGPGRGLGKIAPAPAPAPASVFVRPHETLAPCVHAGPYGTRSSLIGLSGKDAKRAPDLFSADGPPCTAPFVDVTSWWGRR